MHQSAPLLSPVILLRTTLAYRTRPNCENSSFSSSSFTTNGRLLESDYSVGSRESVCVCVCSFTSNGRLLESDYSVRSRERVCVCVCSFTSNGRLLESEYSVGSRESV